MHCFDQRAWFTQEVRLCCLSSPPVASIVWWEISCQSCWAFLACSQWFPRTYIGALNGAPSSLRLSIFLPFFPLCSLGSTISISRSSSCPILPSVSWRPLWSPLGERCTSYFRVFMAILYLMGCHHDTSFTSLWVVAFHSLGIYSSHCEAVSTKSNIWALLHTASVACFFPLCMGHFPDLCVCHDFFFKLKTGYFRQHIVDTDPLPSSLGLVLQVSAYICAWWCG